MSKALSFAIELFDTQTVHGLITKNSGKCKKKTVPAPKGRKWRETKIGQTVRSVQMRKKIFFKKLENVAIANALQLEAARHRAVPIRFNFVARAKFEVTQPVRCRLRAFFLLLRYVTLWPWTLTPWPWPLTLNICRVLAVPWSNSVRMCSAIGQSTQLLQFE